MNWLCHCTAVLFRVLRPFLLVYLAVLLIMVWFEERLIYFPARYAAADAVWRPTELKFEDAWFTAADGTRLHGWYCPVEEPLAVILFAHGNAGHLAWRAEVLKILQSELNCSVLIFDYRGYGRSEGVPDERGVLQDVRAAHQWLQKKTRKQPDEIVLMGRSLGGGVVLDLAAEQGARAVILESGFTSLPDVAALHYPFLPVRMFMKSQLNNLEKLNTYQGPIFISHGNADDLIPFEHGQQLYQAARGKKEFFVVEGGGHNDPQPIAYYEELGKFLTSLQAGS